ncbi:DUF3500 domain-containing protein [Lacipirellula limnantheis]|uniref:DUF3500 domain-containing protein n=1 Tax=Lacipirellula limnantheis TaxID=2528024 RepID=A0A517U182_9BACT|nr:DUF3500 domain-containing protein [Lacipirellula limnantheis]QDT74387.1 hypothetical protein I41_35820 [Lacipirellula limnantheis]
MVRPFVKLSLLLLIALQLVAWQTAAAQAKSPAESMTAAATAFLAGLSPEQRSETIVAFDAPERRDWHNIPKDDRKGVEFGELDADQQKLALALLRSALSDDGYAKALKIMALENNLREGEKNLQGAPLRDPERYYITIFGEPGDKGTWGWSFEGHHFSQNLVVRDGKVVGDTPSFWGANPATVKIFVEGGPEVGTRTLAQEEQLAFDLLASLDASQRAVAVVADTAPADYRGPGQPEPPRAAPEGIQASKLSAAQREKLAALLATYCSNLAPELATARLAEIEAAGAERVHFAWLGAAEPGVGHAYRVQGPTFLLELVNIQSDPAGNPANHIHSVWRSLHHDFGVATAAK